MIGLKVLRHTDDSPPGPSHTDFIAIFFLPLSIVCFCSSNLFLFSMVVRKDQLEASLHEEKKLIQSGMLKEDNPLDVSESFNKLCEACRRGDLKSCQEMITTEGVNINARDRFDYTPLILVRVLLQVFSTSNTAWLKSATTGKSVWPFRSCSTPSRVWCSLRARYLPGREMPV